MPETRPPETEAEIIAEFQRRRREFKPRWTRNVGLVFFPGFVLFLIGSQTDLLALVIPGMALSAPASEAAAVGAFQAPTPRALALRAAIE